MLANRAARFTQPRAQVLTAKPYERRSVCVLPQDAAQAFEGRGVVMRCSGGCHTHLTRAVVEDKVARGEMRFLDRHHNAACYTDDASKTWQKTRSGPVCTMQMIVGEKGRHVPATQEDNWTPEGLAA